LNDRLDSFERYCILLKYDSFIHFEALFLQYFNNIFRKFNTRVIEIHLISRFDEFDKLKYYSTQLKPSFCHSRSKLKLRKLSCYDVLKVMAAHF
jgi:hypothetical protein